LPTRALHLPRLLQFAWFPRDRFLFHNPERADLTGGSHVRAAAKLHRSNRSIHRLATDLHHANDLAVFIAKELLNVRALSSPLHRERPARSKPAHSPRSFRSPISSTSRFCCSVSAALLKSNVNFSGPT